MLNDQRSKFAGQGKMMKSAFIAAATLGGLGAISLLGLNLHAQSAPSEGVARSGNTDGVASVRALAEELPVVDEGVAAVPQRETVAPKTAAVVRRGQDGRFWTLERTEEGVEFWKPQGDVGITSIAEATGSPSDGVARVPSTPVISTANVAPYRNSNADNSTEPARFPGVAKSSTFRELAEATLEKKHNNQGIAKVPAKSKPPFETYKYEGEAARLTVDDSHGVARLWSLSSQDDGVRLWRPVPSREQNYAYVGEQGRVIVDDADGSTRFWTFAMNEDGVRFWRPVDGPFGDDLAPTIGEDSLFIADAVEESGPWVLEPSLDEKPETNEETVLAEATAKKTESETEAKEEETSPQLPIIAARKIPQPEETVVTTLPSADTLIKNSPLPKSVADINEPKFADFVRAKEPDATAEPKPSEAKANDFELRIAKKESEKDAGIEDEIQVINEQEIDASRFLKPQPLVALSNRPFAPNTKSPIDPLAEVPVASTKLLDLDEPTSEKIGEVPPVSNEEIGAANVASLSGGGLDGMRVSQSTARERATSLGIVDFKPIGSVTVNVARSAGKVPEDVAATLFHGHRTEDYRNQAVEGWLESTPIGYEHQFYHRPLYFEDANLERCGVSGISMSFLQPIASGAFFVAQLPMVPYKIGLNHPGESVYSRGDCPEGCQWSEVENFLPPFDLKAAAFTAAVYSGLVIAIP